MVNFNSTRLLASTPIVSILRRYSMPASDKSLKVFTQNFHKNMNLKHYGQVFPIWRTHVTQESSKPIEPSLIQTEMLTPKRPLAVILAWLQAREKHIEKYRQIWLQRGFDVLTVKMTPMQFLIPRLGAKKLVSDLLDFLWSSSPYYPDIVMHCFSVGAYEFGEMLTQLKKDETIEWLMRQHTQLLNGDDPRTVIENSVKAIIFDSAVSFDGITSGVSRSITNNPAMIKLVQGAIQTHLTVSYPFATKYYKESSFNCHHSTLKAPALLLTGDLDKIGSPEMSKNLSEMWLQSGIDVKHVVFANSGHVQHYQHYPEEYVSNLDQLLAKTNLLKK